MQTNPTGSQLEFVSQSDEYWQFDQGLQDTASLRRYRVLKAVFSSPSASQLPRRIHSFTEWVCACVELHGDFPAVR